MRITKPLRPKTREDSLFTEVDPSDVPSYHDAKTIFEMPKMLYDQGIVDSLFHKLMLYDQGIVDSLFHKFDKVGLLQLIGICSGSIHNP